MYIQQMDDLFNNNNYSPIPKPKLNGGLYTGEPFKGPWGNVPVIPDAAYLTYVTQRLSTDNVPTASLYQMQAPCRSGNNSYYQIPGVEHYVGDEKFGKFDLFCVPSVCGEGKKQVVEYDCRDKCQCMTNDCGCGACQSMSGSDPAFYSKNECICKSEPIPVKYIQIA